MLRIVLFLLVNLVLIRLTQLIKEEEIYVSIK